MCFWCEWRIAPGRLSERGEWLELEICESARCVSSEHSPVGAFMCVFFFVIGVVVVTSVGRRAGIGGNCSGRRLRFDCDAFVPNVLYGLCAERAQSRLFLFCVNALF